MICFTNIAKTLFWGTIQGYVIHTSLILTFQSRVYDSNGDLSEYTASFDTGLSRLFSVTTLYTYALLRDDLGRITQKTETIGGVTDVWNYEYDTAGQLTKVKKNGVVYSEYVYDDNGNRTSGKTAGTSFTATYNNQDRLLTYNTRTYAYNANGDLGQIQWNTTQSSYYQYDMFGNYSQFIGTGGGVFNFIHDAFNRRVGLKQGSTVTYRFLYQDQYRVAAQTQGDGKVLKEYFYATESNSPDYMVDYTSTPAVKYRIIKDHLGSPRLVVNTTSNIVAQRLDYNDLGEITSETGTAFFQPFAFAGGLHEPNSKMVRFGARDYDPRTGRWTSKDPILFAGGDANLYGYVINDPVNWNDPSGLRAPKTKESIPYSENVKIAKNMGAWRFYLAVKTNGIWDYKNIYKKSDNRSSYADAGNYNYAITGMACGFSPDTLQKAAGAYQVYSGTSSFEFGIPFLQAPYGDDYIDQYWINQGIQDYQSGMYGK